METISTNPPSTSQPKLDTVCEPLQTPAVSSTTPSQDESNAALPTANQATLAPTASPMGASLATDQGTDPTLGSIAATDSFFELTKIPSSKDLSSQSALGSTSCTEQKASPPPTLDIPHFELSGNSEDSCKSPPGPSTTGHEEINPPGKPPPNTIPIPTLPLLPRNPGTIIIIGAAGSLGSATAKALAKNSLQAQTPPHHLLLTTRKLKNDRVTSLTTSLRDMGYPTNLTEWMQLDLCSFSDIRKFALEVRKQIASNELPGPLVAIINSAALIQWKAGLKSEDGIEQSLQINLLGPFLLISLFLQPPTQETGTGFTSALTLTHPENKNQNQNQNEGSEKNTATNHPTTPKIIWVSSGSQAIGSTAHFSSPWFKNSEAKTGKTLDFFTGMRKYGSSKRMAIFLVREMQKRLDGMTPTTMSPPHLLSFDPGFMTGPASSSPNAPPSLHHFVHTLNIIGPHIRDLIHQPLAVDPDFVAEALVGWVLRDSNGGEGGGGKGGKGVGGELVRLRKVLVDGVDGDGGKGGGIAKGDKGDKGRGERVLEFALGFVGDGEEDGGEGLRKFWEGGK
ncbi:MAG: hypothetical protein M1834_005209 [Cirrosporium novae-zelandiae]|nr:MAG: hypothetical protein M1834_005209 [Cirrosporium novae-zelandiae]